VPALLLAVAAGLVVANLYYNQPLLAVIARDFGVPEARVAPVATLTQVGYAVGLFAVVPLADVAERGRRSWARPSRPARRRSRRPACSWAC
jgi:MFS family permease